MKAAHDEMCAATDPFRVWMDECIEDDLDGVAPCESVRASHFAFRRARGIPPISMTAFGLELKKKKWGLEVKERTANVAGKLKVTNCYIGIRLKTKE
jgi:hypothetical protein